MITTSGAAPPRSSTSSYAIVLQPSIATGWLPSGGFETFDTGRKPHWSETSRFSVQRSGADGAATTSAPKLRMNRTIGPRKLRVVKTMHGIPARAAYAAAVAPAFPDEETATPRRPCAARPRDRQRAEPVLERPGRVLALVLRQQAREPHVRTDGLARYERRRALPERDGDVRTQGQRRVVAPEPARPALPLAGIDPEWFRVLDLEVHGDALGSAGGTAEVVAVGRVGAAAADAAEGDAGGAHALFFFCAMAGNSPSASMSARTEETSAAAPVVRSIQAGSSSGGIRLVA